MSTKFWSENLKGRDHLDILDVEDNLGEKGVKLRTTLKWLSREMFMNILVPQKQRIS
jgi:hypothetical protein